MSKTSTVTVRRTPVQGPSSSAGSLVVHADTVTIQTRERVELVDLTGPLAAFVAGAGVREGVLSVWSLHTTCAVFINEAQRALHADIKRVLEQIIDRDTDWMHNDPAESDCDRRNADAHLRAMLLGHSLTLQVSGGEIVLGQWQRVLAAELDGPRARTLRLQIMGVA
ncbi:MAG TPA: secondary thiamine-phosphate synthase enzyme YjbQ [Vicinamibacterales bacterium]|nr:secondary thiamine-phosphate synthase enzyme YjbQ [Vicinamibacterales bacterium]